MRPSAMSIERSSPITASVSVGRPKCVAQLGHRRPRGLADHLRPQRRSTLAIAAVTIAPRLKIIPFAPAYPGHVAPGQQRRAARPPRGRPARARRCRCRRRGPRTRPRRPRRRSPANPPSSSRARIASLANASRRACGWLRRRYVVALSTGVSTSSSATGSPSSRSPRAIVSAPTWLPLVNSTSGRPEARMRSSTSTAPGCGRARPSGARCTSVPSTSNTKPLHVVERTARLNRHGATPRSRRP